MTNSLTSQFFSCQSLVGALEEAVRSRTLIYATQEGFKCLTLAEAEQHFGEKLAPLSLKRIKEFAESHPEEPEIKPLLGRFKVKKQVEMQAAVEKTISSMKGWMPEELTPLQNEGKGLETQFLEIIQYCQSYLDLKPDSQASAFRPSIKSGRGLDPSHPNFQNTPPPLKGGVSERLKEARG